MLCSHLCRLQSGPVAGMLLFPFLQNPRGRLTAPHMGHWVCEPSPTSLCHCTVLANFCPVPFLLAQRGGATHCLWSKSWHWLQFGSHHPHPTPPGSPGITSGLLLCPQGFNGCRACCSAKLERLGITSFGIQSDGEGGARPSLDPFRARVALACCFDLSFTCCFRAG